MVFKKYWKAILGFAFWLWPIWDFIKWLLDWKGRIDALAASYHDIGGYHIMIAYLLNPPSWLYPPFMVAGLALIWWSFHRTPVEMREHVAIKTSISPLVVSSVITSVNAIDGWEKLYEEYNTANREEFRLRFLPDTDDRASDALLLICYGYKIIKKKEPLSVKFVNSQIEYLLQHAPNTRESPIYRVSNAVAFALSDRDFGKTCVSQGTIERIGLSKGGFYRLTNWGEEKATNLARDLIGRA